MAMTETYRCIKPFEVPIVDEDGCKIDKCKVISLNSLYKLETPQLTKLTDADFRLELISENSREWIEISRKKLDDHFELEKIDVWSI